MDDFPTLRKLAKHQGKAAFHGLAVSRKFPCAEHLHGVMA